MAEVFFSRAVVGDIEKIFSTRKRDFCNLLANLRFIAKYGGRCGVDFGHEYINLGGDKFYFERDHEQLKVVGVIRDSIAHKVINPSVVYGKQVIRAARIKKEKETLSVIKTIIKGSGWKFCAGYLYKVDNSIFYSVQILFSLYTCETEYSVVVKPLSLDDLFWLDSHWPENINAPVSFRNTAALMARVPSVVKHKVFDADLSSDQLAENFLTFSDGIFNYNRDKLIGNAYSKYLLDLQEFSYIHTPALYYSYLSDRDVIKARQLRIDLEQFHPDLNFRVAIQPICSEVELNDLLRTYDELIEKKRKEN